METIYLIDYLGIHCGMHFYLEAFKRILDNVIGINNVRILSNYSDSSENKAFFLNQYKGNNIQKGLSLCYNVIKLKGFIKHHPDDIYVYLSYGNSIDLLFLRIVSKAKKHVIDIHEAIAQNLDSKFVLKQKFAEIYKNKIDSIISHSSRTDNFLDEYRFNGTRLYVPHFKYVFPKDYNLNSIPNEIVNSISKDKINLLFFGNLNESKGVDILIDAVNKLSDKDAEKINVIIAGKDFDGTVDRVKVLDGRHVHIFKRHISDDELRFLYQNVDYLALPYRKTSQSGILEMAFYFKKPIIATDVPYFRTTLEEFPSFGILSGNDSPGYSKTLSKIISTHNSVTYFLDSDYARYENRKEIQLFLNDFKSWMEDRRL